MRTQQLRIVLAMLSVVTFERTSVAQVYIADQEYRNELNEALPGLVDPSGFMDTQHPGIAELDSLRIDVMESVGPTIELNGLEHLTAVNSLSIFYSTVDTTKLIIPSCPPGMQHMTIQTSHEQDSVWISGLPALLPRMSIFQSPPGDTWRLPMSFPDLTGGIEWLDVSGLVDLNWPGTPQIGRMNIGDYYNGDFIAPSANVGNLLLSSMYVNNLDLSSITTAHLETGSNCTCTGQLSWPSGVTDLSSEMYTTAPLPAWPPGLDTLYLREGYGCLHPFPAGLQSLEFHYGFDCLPNWPPLLESISTLGGSVWVQESTATYCSVLNSDCPGAYPALAGKVFMDLNQNGVADPNEPPVPSCSVGIAPGGQSTGSSSDGTWEIGVPPGEHTIALSSDYPYMLSVNPASHAGSVPVMGDVDLNNDFAMAVQPDVQDLRVHLYADPARPGFDNRVYLRCENYGTMPVDAEVNLSFDADQSWVGSSLTPTSQSGNTASWSFPAMPIGGVQNIVVDLNTAVSVALGTDIVHTLSAGQIATDETPSDNSYTFNDSVVGSFDPNDKLLDPKVLSPAEVAQGGTPIEYTIRFQNTGTYLAERVVIVDTLPEGLQPQSIEFLSSSHSCHWYVVDGVLHFIHEGIDLPDSTSDEPGSHGYVRFRILPDTDLSDGAEVVNIAHIVFDFNEPIITPSCVFRVEVLASVEETEHRHFSLVPNPAQDQVRIVPAEGGGNSLRYQLRDMPGRTINTGRTDGSGVIDITSLPAGTYMIGIEHEGNQRWARLVKR